MRIVLIALPAALLASSCSSGPPIVAEVVAAKLDYGMTRSQLNTAIGRSPNSTQTMICDLPPPAQSKACDMLGYTGETKSRLYVYLETPASGGEETVVGWNVVP